MQAHYRLVFNFLNNECKGKEAFTHEHQFDSYLDAGYLLIDFNKKIIVNSQLAFAFADLDEQIKKNLQTKWEVITLL